MSWHSTIPIQIGIYSLGTKINFLLPLTDEYKVKDLLNDLNLVYRKKGDSSFCFLSNGNEILSSEIQISKYIDNQYKYGSNIEIEAFTIVDDYFQSFDEGYDDDYYDK